jgi:hypothetical protein
MRNPAAPKCPAGQVGRGAIMKMGRAGGGLSLLAFFLWVSEPCPASDLLPSLPSATPPSSAILSPVPIAEQRIESRPNSIFVFGGRLSTTDIYSTLLVNTNPSDKPIRYDNSIVGAAYGRDWFSLGYGFVVGGEVGLADRLGYYYMCCDTIEKSNHLLHSGELWSGISIRYQSPVLFNLFRVSPGLVGGFSATTDSIGRERERQGCCGNARLLFYLGAELAFSTADSPLEFVMRLHHRSGADGTLGNIKEGYNGNIAGLRYRF